MSKKVIIKICWLLIIFPLTLWSQEPIGGKDAEVKVLGFVTKDAIKLRWGVTTPTAWKHSNTYGYTIQRKTIAIGDSILKEPIIKNITQVPIKPKPMEEWEQFALSNDHAAIAAQAIYGEGFEVEMEDGGNALITILNQAKVLEQRFSFALFAADQNFEVAKFSGLAYVDTDIKQNERYLYRVYTAIPPEKMDVKFGGVYLGLDDYYPLPAPIDFTGIYKDHAVTLSWNYELLKEHYNSYILERSDDEGTTFNQMTDVPMVNMNDNKNDKSDRMFFIDSLPQNNKVYQYRIKGISPFGEIGPESKIVSGSGKKPLVHNPAILEAKLASNNTSARITWEFPDEALETLSHFELNHSNQVKEGYKVVMPNISKNTRSITYTNLDVINYFTITAVGNNGGKRTSFPQMVQPVDDTPPATPVQLTGTIDSLGVVQLQWQQNTEVDFLGYRVFRANLENEEFTQITFKTIPKSTITDTINLKTLNTKIHYKVQAFDKRYNPSGFSEVVALKKPDIIPPTPPVFESFNADHGVVKLEWITSSSMDAVKTSVYRKEKGTDTSWQLITDVDLPEGGFVDESAIPGVVYLYTLVTVDESDLESEPIAPLTISLPDNQPKPALDKFNALVNREAEQIVITWKYNQPKVLEYILYKGEEETKPTMYKVFDASTTKFIDQKLTINTAYTYLLQAVFTSGAKSPIKKIGVEY
ncbi:hypothetical protein ABW636_00695 [Aquimarina sp. 2201CG1-2-11]|uniref:fibronectin type III domain-containing protein n=1 Tax=Aquimarina discodermiae TaxID=3231043 RepID=UPI00346201ED